MAPQRVDVPSSISIEFLEELYAAYQHDASSVPEEWRGYFYSLSNGGGRLEPPATLAPTEVSECEPGARCRICGRQESVAALQQRVDRLIRNYRARGHQAARLDPLGFDQRPEPDELAPAFHGLTEEVMDQRFAAGTLARGQSLPLREIIQKLRNTYCRSIGAQFMHIDDIGVRQWLQERMEPSENRLKVSRREQLRILRRLTNAVNFEEFIQKKYVGAKRFSLEGAESLIPLLDLAIERAGEKGVEEIVLAMAHRGRLNVLANIMKKSPLEIFLEFEDAHPERYVGRGDVKYHLGYHSDWQTDGGQDVHLALCFNPSHLEYVNPAALGRTRAKQDRLADLRREKGMCILIHGDAAFAGEGIVQETLNLSQLPAFETGGTIHVVVNNQLGFTTTPSEGRSTRYATDVVRMLQAPIFHVNGEDPEAVAQVIRLAMDFRYEFKKDVVVDMYCYRRQGHNESDEPAFTQPLLYKAIRERKSVREGYLEHLLKLGEVTRDEADAIAQEQRDKLDAQLTQAKKHKEPELPRHRPSILGRIWKQYRGGMDSDVPDANTGVARDQLVELLNGLNALPEGFTHHPRLKRFFKARAAMAAGEQPLDWATGEALAFATLAVEGAPVRLCGQDSARGTFSQRHAVFYDYETGEGYMPLDNLTEDQAPVRVVNSPLSEAGVLGYEYGYSLAYPDALVMWEAQFGDFVNAAQVLIDQGITSAEDKWGSLSGLVMLLPHGFEGMGPEHSSARLERFLTLAAEDNIQVANPSTPAQYFHLLRRQVVRPYRKPLVVMTPKSMLRMPEASSNLDELAQGRFQRMLPDPKGVTGAVDRVLLCSGKVYYDLVEAREERERDDVAILRAEQLYPLQESYLDEALSPYPEGTPVMWVQEEPENMGAWQHVHGRFCGGGVVGKWPLHGAYRPANASTATGSASSHRLEQQRLIEDAFRPLD